MDGRAWSAALWHSSASPARSRLGRPVAQTMVDRDAEGRTGQLTVRKGILLASARSFRRRPPLAPSQAAGRRRRPRQPRTRVALGEIRESLLVFNAAHYRRNGQLDITASTPLWLTAKRHCDACDSRRGGRFARRTRWSSRSADGEPRCDHAERCRRRHPWHAGRMASPPLERSALHSGPDDAARLHRAAGGVAADAPRARPAVEQRGAHRTSGCRRSCRRCADRICRRCVMPPFCCFCSGCRSSRWRWPIRTPSFTREEVSYPGRRIALLVDASTSMITEVRDQEASTRRTAARSSRPWPPPSTS